MENDTILIIQDISVTWSPRYAWSIPLSSGPFGSEPADRFLEVLKLQSQDLRTNPWQKAAISVLLFRCHFEGYGTPQNFQTAARYLREAATYGDHIAQAKVLGYHKTFKLPSLDLNEARKHLFAAAFRSRDYSAMQDMYI